MIGIQTSAQGWISMSGEGGAARARSIPAIRSVFRRMQPLTFGGLRPLRAANPPYSGPPSWDGRAIRPRSDAASLDRGIAFIRDQNIGSVANRAVLPRAARVAATPAAVCPLPP